MPALTRSVLSFLIFSGISVPVFAQGGTPADLPAGQAAPRVETRFIPDTDGVAPPQEAHLLSARAAVLDSDDNDSESPPESLRLVGVISLTVLVLGAGTWLLQSRSRQQPN